MKLEAVTVCVDFSEWLCQCLTNRDKFDRWVIVTHVSDIDTIRLCEAHNMEYVLSMRVFDEGTWFAKGRAINDALKKMDCDGWLLSVDADVKLPDDFRETLDREVTDEQVLYGSYRYDARINRMSQEELDGKPMPYGFFQLWHSSVTQRYLENSSTAAGDDWNFSRTFGDNIQMLPLKCRDVYGGQGHYEKNYYGIRNMLRKQ